MESSRTSLVSRTSSRTHFEVLGLEGQVLGLEASSPQKLPCPRLEDSTFFELLKFCRLPEKKILEGVFYWRTPEKTFEDFFLRSPEKFFEDLFFFGEHLRLCPWSLASSIPVLGLKRVCPRKGCPWPRIFFVSLVLTSSLVSSTPPLLIFIVIVNFGFQSQ